MNYNASQQAGNTRTLPVIAGHEIAMDEHGRFNLNAIHRAGGGIPHKRPSQWARRDEAQELMAEISQSANLHFDPVHSVRGGSQRGTFAHELLAVSYAGWISPRFQLQVNQVFLDYRQGRLAATPDAGNITHTAIGADGFRCLAAILDGRLRHLAPATRKRAQRHLWSQVHRAFGVSRAEDIPAAQFDNARQFIGSYALDGQWLPAPSQTGGLSDYDRQNLYVVCSHMLEARRIFRDYQMYDALKMLGSPAGVELYGRLTEGGSIAAHYARMLNAPHQVAHS